MQHALYVFIRQYLGVVCFTLLPVILTAFLSMPTILGGHPGEPRTDAAMVERHLT